MSFADSAQPRRRGGGERDQEFSIGYSFQHDRGLDFPIGIAVDGAWRIGWRMDFVLAAQINHASLLGVSVTEIGAGGGLRWRIATWVPSARRASPYVQVLVGLVHGSAAAFGSGVSASGFGIQPAAGIDLPVGRNTTVRPQLEATVYHVPHRTGTAVGFNLSLVFRPGR